MRIRTLLILLLAPLFLAGCSQDLPTAGEQAAFVIEDPGMPVGPGRLVGGPPFPDQNLNGVVCMKGGGGEVEPEGQGGGGGPIVFIDDVGGTCPPAFERFDLERRGRFFFLFLADTNRNALVCVKGPLKVREPAPRGMEELFLLPGAIVVLDDRNGECPPPFLEVRLVPDDI